MEQLTIRGVPKNVCARLRDRAYKERRSLNSIVVEALTLGAGCTEEKVRFNDLDDLAGTWVADPAFDKAVAEMDRVDEELWR